MNSILTLYPYKFHGQWVFDDQRTDLVREAFISGIDTMLDNLTEDIENADQGVILIFSEGPFPGSQITLDWQKEESGGNWYFCREQEISGWLCPALYKYFPTAPKTIYAQVKESKI